MQVPRLLRLGRLMVMFDHMKNTNILRIVQLMMAMILLAHWVTCTWSFLANASTDIPWVFDTLETDGEMYAMGRYQYGYMLSLTLMVRAFRAFVVICPAACCIAVKSLLPWLFIIGRTDKESFFRPLCIRWVTT